MHAEACNSAVTVAPPVRLDWKPLQIGHDGVIESFKRTEIRCEAIKVCTMGTKRASGSSRHYLKLPLRPRLVVD